MEVVPFEIPGYPARLLTPDRNGERLVFRPVIVATCVAIELNDIQRLQSALSEAHYEEVSEELFDDCLEEYMSRCAKIHFEKKSDRVEIGLTLFTHFEQALEKRELHSEQCSLYQYILLSYSFSDPTIKFLRVLRPDDTFEELMCDLIDAPESTTTGYAARRIVESYPGKPAQTYVELYAQAELKQNETMMEFLEAKLKELAPPCQKPTYLRKFDQPLKLPAQDEKTKTGFQTMASILYERLNTLGIQVKGKADPAIQHIASILASSNPEQRKILLDYIDKSNSPESEAADELTVFRLLGPLNAFTADANPSAEDCICSHYGGCRMFACNEFEYDEDDEELVEQEGVEDWFTGNCEHCFLAIPNRVWCVRRPLLSGGWKGCYCSWQCVREGIYILELDPKQENMLIARTNQMEADMHQIGIADQ